MVALSRPARVAAGMCGWLGLVAAASCTVTPEMAPLEQGPPARVESLLATGALLNAVTLTEGGAGATVGEFGAITSSWASSIEATPSGVSPRCASGSRGSA